MPELSLSDVEAVCLILLEIPADKELEEDSPAGSSANSVRRLGHYTQTAHGMIGEGWTGAKLLD
jgi:hypothetical protein